MEGRWIPRVCSLVKGQHSGQKEKPYQGKTQVHCTEYAPLLILHGSNRILHRGPATIYTSATSILLKRRKKMLCALRVTCVFSKTSLLTGKRRSVKCPH